MQCRCLHCRQAANSQVELRWASQHVHCSQVETLEICKLLMCDVKDCWVVQLDSLLARTLGADIVSFYEDVRTRQMHRLVM